MSRPAAAWSRLRRQRPISRPHGPPQDLDDQRYTRSPTCSALSIAKPKATITYLSIPTSSNPSTELGVPRGPAPTSPFISGGASLDSIMRSGPAEPAAKSRQHHRSLPRPLLRPQTATLHREQSRPRSSCLEGDSIVKIVDFAWAPRIGDTNFHPRRPFMGRSELMSLEQLTTAQSQRTDVIPTGLSSLPDTPPGACFPSKASDTGVTLMNIPHENPARLFRNLFPNSRRRSGHHAAGARESAKSALLPPPRTFALTITLLRDSAHQSAISMQQSEQLCQNRTVPLPGQRARLMAVLKLDIKHQGRPAILLSLLRKAYRKEIAPISLPAPVTEGGRGPEGEIGLRLCSFS